ncbi:Spo0E family sporulation regulatory protein-aspartic acid phosphatase [Terrilactibacillus sp. BCM23-1]|uniref:Spo0E family sporulation regulatory protein-aspartic acid phosphatase n=1 Tax=Terrilactibacillus tamarindi TaxID=2599694 RepID=A0A6N8CM36_9BACI|nr:Spo0E family sporulation regulatory protein-aspartic acid phosphatase [Terrilactibacillus tamarindi]MTT30658.1 Spo0E family sporulation regulatory protein-aspartic acid phosphatase [Terrilactibacillus tamarindi]
MNKENVYAQIELFRHRMISTAIERGFLDPTVLEYSRQIDYLHNVLIRRSQGQTVN